MSRLLTLAIQIFIIALAVALFGAIAVTLGMLVLS
ncbi:hypothetical protein UFOVP1672_60 [uncultured Caudovirales phage]|uniref:Uncharacterized protein n=1 Tax=uncultured Caudovirales phage TaxID=2100421 RepID=A0A6J5SC81_9CAUD|nr:hypothetical protein UFOVP988_82 [uncultured Caudovirales phage]CAB4211098.1 hypothetical protein UFOVP1425_82 [uncultured Caudovirales phage]CAB4223459.1 hypothetical protein UFOVP1672_60 [uncultured Caudovirales phage]